MNLFLSLILALASIKLSSACSCFPALLQDRVCQEDPNRALFRATVVGMNVIGDPLHGQHRYTLKMVKVYQDVSERVSEVALPSSTPRNLRLEVFSYIADSLCGMTLQVGANYLLDAYFSTHMNHFDINSCGFTQQWPTDVDLKRQLHMLLKKPDCKCKVRDCMSWMAEPDCETDPQGDDECILPPYSTDAACSTQYSRCKRCGGICGWHGRPNSCP